MITRPWAFIVWGEAMPKGSMKCVGGRGKVKHQLIEANKVESHKWRHKVAGVARQLVAEQADQYQAIQVEITYTKARPGDHYGTGRNASQLKATAPQYPTKRSGGDIDKLERNVLDALQEAGVLVDDAQVVDVHHHARFIVPERNTELYADALPKPGVLVRIRPMVQAALVELPVVDTRAPCPHISNGEFCRYYEHGPETPHQYGGGLGDVISNRHCGEPEQHDTHAWPPSAPAHNCGGAALERRWRQTLADDETLD